MAGSRGVSKENCVLDVVCYENRRDADRRDDIKESRLHSKSGSIVKCRAGLLGKADCGKSNERSCKSSHLALSGTALIRLVTPGDFDAQLQETRFGRASADLRFIPIARKGNAMLSSSVSQGRATPNALRNVTHADRTGLMPLNAT